MDFSTCRAMRVANQVMVLRPHFEELDSRPDVRVCRRRRFHGTYLYPSRWYKVPDVKLCCKRQQME